MSVERGATARCNEYDVSFLCGVAVDMVHLSPVTFQVALDTVDPSSVNIQVIPPSLSIGFYSREGVYRYRNQLLYPLSTQHLLLFSSYPLNTVTLDRGREWILYGENTENRGGMTRARSPIGFRGFLQCFRSACFYRFFTVKLAQNRQNCNFYSGICFLNPSANIAS